MTITASWWRAALAEVVRRRGATLDEYASVRLALLEELASAGPSTPLAEVIPIRRAQPEVIRGGGVQLLG